MKKRTKPPTVVYTLKDFLPLLDDAYDRLGDFIARDEATLQDKSQHELEQMEDEVLSLQKSLDSLQAGLSLYRAALGKEWREQERKARIIRATRV